MGALEPLRVPASFWRRSDALERIADGLRMPDDARVRLGLAPRNGGVRRRTALGIGLVAAISPATLTAVLRESAAEAVEYTRLRGATAVGAGTLDHLTTVIAGLDRAYPWQPAHGAYLSHILSDLTHDLGSTVAARAYANDAAQLADHAGHDELCAWAADSLAVALLHDDQPREAEHALHNGLRRAPRRHPLAARLYARLALAHAHTGNQTGTIDALTRARRRCDRLPTQMPSRLATDTAEHIAHSITSYAASCHIDLHNWHEAETEARAALDVAKWSPGRAGSAHLDLGTALANLGSPDEAASHGQQAFALRVGCGRGRTRAAQLDAVLTTRYPDEPAVKDFHDRYRTLATQAIQV